MNCLKKFLLSIAVGSATIILSGCYGVIHRDIDTYEHNELRISPEPIHGLQTVVSPEQQD